MPTTRPELTWRRAAVGTVLASAVLLAACGGSDPDASPDTISPDTISPDTISPDTISPDTTLPDTSPPDTASPDTGPPDTTIESTIAPSAQPLTNDDLAGIMPSPEVFGPGFTVEDSPAPAGEGAIITDESLAVCPALADVLNSGDGESTAVRRQYQDPNSSLVYDIAANVGSEGVDPAAVEADYSSVVSAISSCPVIAGDVAGIGTYVGFPTAEVTDGPGDGGFRFALEGDIATAVVTFPLDVALTTWTHGNVSVIVSTTSGVDDAFEPVPADPAILDQVINDLDASIADLIG